MHGIFRGKYRGQGKRDNQPFSVDELPPLKKRAFAQLHIWKTSPREAPSNADKRVE